MANPVVVRIKRTRRVNQSAICSITKRKKRALATAMALAFLFVLPACGIPNRRFPTPTPPLPSSFDLRKADMGRDLPEAFEDETTTENSSQIKIEEFYTDPLITSVMHQAMFGNLELRVLAENVQIARNDILAKRGAYIPFFFFGGSAAADKPSLFTRNGAVDDTLSFRPGLPIPNPLPNYALGPTLFWQLDPWRQLHNARDAAALRYFATAEARSFFTTQVLAEIADNYFQLVALDKRIEILDQTIALQQQSMEVAKKLMQGARGTQLGVLRFESVIRRNQSEKLIIGQEIVAVENRINFLAGRFPQHVERMTGDFINLKMHALGVGVPSELLQYRPDIRQAERELAAAGLDVKVARARFFPVVTLTGGVGYEAFNPRFLMVTPESIAANIAGQMLVPLVNKKAIRADFLTADARQLQALYDYQRTILNAFTEVITRMAKVEFYRRSVEVKKRQVDVLNAAIDVAQNLFTNARLEYLDVLVALRDLREARTELVETKQLQLSAIVNTYQALGGGAYLSPVPNPPQYHPWEH